jgi:hypothetical protein
MRNFTFQLANDEELIEREKEPCKDTDDARGVAKRIAEALKQEGWNGGPGSYLAVLDERGNELFREEIWASD